MSWEEAFLKDGQHNSDAQVQFALHSTFVK